MEQLYFHGTILPMTGEGDTLEALLVRDGLIAEAGAYEELSAAAPGAEEIDLRGRTMLPGFCLLYTSRCV